MLQVTLHQVYIESKTIAGPINKAVLKTERKQYEEEYFKLT